MMREDDLESVGTSASRLSEQLNGTYAYHFNELLDKCRLGEPRIPKEIIFAEVVPANRRAWISKENLGQNESLTNTAVPLC